MKKLFNRSCTITLVAVLALLLVVMGWQQWRSKMHFVGKGADGPTQALTRFADAIDTQEYQAIRELLFFQLGVCGGMDLMAVDTKDGDMLELSFQDHFSLLASDPSQHGERNYAAYAGLLNKNILPFRWNMLHYTAYLRSLNLDQYINEKKIRINIPLLSYLDWPNQLVVDPNCSFNTLTLLQWKGHWYVYNFSCQSLGLLIPGEIQPNYSEIPLIDPELLLEMCARGRATPERI